MIRLFKENSSLLIYGILLTFFSGFGQTFFISLFVPSFVSSFGLTNAAFGSVYAVITIASAFALIYLGKLVDQWKIQKFTLFVIGLLFISILVTSFSFHPAIFFFGLWGMRLAGQGLMPHASVSYISRSFEKDRGKALSISTLGHPLGEAMLPLMMLVLLDLYEWRISLAIGAGVFACLLLPYVFLINFQDRSPGVHNPLPQKQWRQIDVLKSRDFYNIVPGIFIPTFLTTSLFLYQASLADEKGWSMQWMAFCFTGFAIARIIALLFSGSLTDKFGARNLFPFYLLPFMLGLLILLLSREDWAAYMYMALTGFTIGIGSTIKSALQADVFGVSSIGAVRSLFTMVMVISTALGPPVVGGLLDVGYTFNELIIGSLFILVLVSWWSFRVNSGSFSMYRNMVLHEFRKW
ncbi:MAG: MFS transporter [Cytophagaceae bacterium]